MSASQAKPFSVVTPAKAGVCPGFGISDEPQAWMDPGLRRDDGCCAGGRAMSRVLSSAQLSSWALCPGSIVPLVAGASDRCAMDPRDKPWDDRVLVGALNAGSGLGWIPACAGMTAVSSSCRAAKTELVPEVAR